MKQVLIYQNRKSDPVVWDASSEEQLASAFLALFKHLKDEERVYNGTITKNEQDTFNRACSGDWLAAKALLTRRRFAEYEEWLLVNVQPHLK